MNIMSSLIPRFTRATIHNISRVPGLRRPNRTVAPNTAHVAEPFYTKSAKIQEEKYLELAGGQKYLKSAFKHGLKKELKEFEHHQYAQMTREELYALHKMKYGGSINKGKAKMMAAAAFEIAQKYKTEKLAQGLNTSKSSEATKRLLKMEHDSEPAPLKVSPQKDRSNQIAERRAVLQSQQGGAPSNNSATPAVLRPAFGMNHQPTLQAVEKVDVPTSHHSNSPLINPSSSGTSYIPGAHTSTHDATIGLGMPVVVHHDVSSPVILEPAPSTIPTIHELDDLHQPMPTHPHVPSSQQEPMPTPSGGDEGASN